jgi:hypothetical protein
MQAHLAASIANAVLAGALSMMISLTFATPARAGSYDVYACYGGVDNSWAQFADPGMAAYDVCPNNPNDLISGIVTRASVGSGSVGYLQDAYQVFTAPSGASLAQMTFDVSPYRWSSDWTVGFVAFDGDFNRGDLPWGCYAGQAGCGIAPGSFFGPITIPLYGHGQVRLETRCGNTAGCTLASTGRYPYTRATISIADVVVRVQDFTAPALSWTGGGLIGGGWLRGVQGLSFDASDNVGIRETRVSVDGAPITSRGKPCDYSLRAPCPQGGDGYSLDTATIHPDGAHSLRAEAIDAAGNYGWLGTTILVDNTPPGQPQNLAVQGGEGWRSHDDFRLRWQNPPEDAAPIAGARYELCPSGGGDCVRGGQDGQGIESLELRVPRAGEYVARLWLRDAAGNDDPKTAGPPLRLRFDDEAPALAFEPQDPSDPTRIAVSASDRISGVADGEIEARRAGSPAWLPLATSLEETQLVAYLDDERLPAGTYELRARAVDRAGNERSTDLRVDGTQAEVALPVRAVTHLRAGARRSSAIRPHGKKKRRPPARRRLRLRFGQGARVTGRLSDAGGRPIAGAEVDVFAVERREGATFTRLATLHTSHTGRISYLVRAGPSRVLRLRYPGSATVRGATSDVELLVSGATSIAVSHHFALNGGSVTFTGRLRGQPAPAAGKLVELQAHVRGAWHTFATTTCDRRGVWRYRYRFTGTHGRQSYSFRAGLPREATYPYESGYSRPVRITVVGL